MEHRCASSLNSQPHTVEYKCQKSSARNQGTESAACRGGRLQHQPSRSRPCTTSSPRRRKRKPTRTNTPNHTCWTKSAPTQTASGPSSCQASPRLKKLRAPSKGTDSQGWLTVVQHSTSSTRWDGIDPTTSVSSTTTTSEPAQGFSLKWTHLGRLPGPIRKSWTSTDGTR